MIAGLWFAAVLLASRLAPGQELNQDPGLNQDQQVAQQAAPQFGSPANEPGRVAVHGLVRNGATGQPLPRALVRIEGDASTGTLTDGEGRFEIAAVPAWPQTFRVVKPGFHDRPYATEEVGYPAEGPAHSVLVAAQMPELNFVLTPNCAIHGHIELSTGDPAEGMTVMLLKRVIRFGRGVWLPNGSAPTNGEGMYRFGGLPEGVYALYTQPALESEPAVTAVAAGSGAKIARDGFPSIFYPDAREFSGAAHIQLAAGEQAEANFTLTSEPFYTVTAMGALPGSRSAPAPPGNSAIVLDASGHLLPYVPQYDSVTQTLQANLPNGTYVMEMQTFLHPGSAYPSLEIGSVPAKESHNTGEVSGSVEFTVDGHAVAGLRIPLGPVPINAILLRYVHSDTSQSGATTPRTNTSEMVNLTLDRADGMPSAFGDSVSMIDGIPDAVEFTAQPGAYWVNMYLPRKGWCAGPLNGGGLNLALDPLTVSLSNPTPPMELTLRDDCATLALSLPQGLAVFAPGEEKFYTVYVVPDFDTTVYIPPMTMHPSSGATLTLDGLTPGNYHIYTFDSPIHLEYRNPAVMAALSTSGQAVTLSPGTTASLTLEAQ